MDTIKDAFEIWTPDQPADRAVLGGKGFNLSRLMSNPHIEVPNFIVLTQKAFFAALTESERLAWWKLSDKERASIVEHLALSPSTILKLQSELALYKLDDVHLAVRSSAIDEDGSHLSYAGQFTSVLNVKARNVATAVEQVWRSAFTSQLSAYRNLNGLSAPPEPPCVIIQRMVPAIASGVAFGANPLSGNTAEKVISAVHGLGDKLVSGEVDAATYILSNAEVIERNSESLCPLTDQQLQEICDVVDLAGEIFGGPQDVEWAIDKFNKLFLVQSRPITTLKTASLSSSPGESEAVGANNETQDARLDIFDNSNIGESYPGTTTPLTFSFARKAYQHVYETFCRLMGVSESAIAKHSFIFPQMLGFVRGRIYYNLLNWYRLLSLFPGFKTNRGFMEQMMGVKSELPHEFLAEFNRELTLKERVLDGLSLSVSIPKLLLRWIKLNSDVENFNARVETSLERMPQNFSETTTVELGKIYRAMEQDLLQKWDAPIVNDFFAMVSFGLLRGVCAKWLGNFEGIHNQLLCGETGIVSTEPVTRMQELASLAASDETLLAVLKTATTQPSNPNTSEYQSMDKRLQSYPAFYSKYVSYLNKFGDRCTGELKLESPTLSDNPIAFIIAIVRLAETKSSGVRNSAATDFASANREDAEYNALNALRANPLKLTLFKLVLSETRSRIRERENLRFMRTRVFGAVRRIFVELGRRFASQNVLNEASEIFWLETEEALRFIEGTSSSACLKSIASARRSEHAMFQTMPAPPDRFSIRHGLSPNCSELETDSSDWDVSKEMLKSDSDSFSMKGLGCCPGTISGYARIIENPNIEHLLEGELLVAKRTDPGWITVIAQARGIVVEYGSLLSHTAIVARELGIPTVVSVSNVTTSVNSGDWLDINGATGEVSVTPRTADVTLTDEQCEKETVAELHACANSSVSQNSKIEPAETSYGLDEKLMKSEIQNKAGFSFVRYAQCWEDSDIVIEAMKIKSGETCVSIASAGDNSLALLIRNPHKVIALDLNPAQLALLELKVMAFKHLSYEEMLVVLGYKPGKNRLELFTILSTFLSASALQYWNQHRDDIEYGVARSGKFEHYFDVFRRFSLPLTHSKRTVNKLLKPKCRSERESFFNQRWNTFRWRALFKVFFSEFVMGTLGRDPSFFTYADGGLPGALMQWTRKALVEQDPSQNPYLHWILKGEFGDSLPTFIRRENFETIKRNIDKLEWRQQSIEEFLSNANEASIDSLNLSDVFEYVSEENYRSIMKLIARASKPGARVVYWNMMARRTSRSSNVQQVNELAEVSEKLFAENKTFFYSRFIVEEIDHSFTECETSAQPVIESTADEPRGRAA